MTLTNKFIAELVFDANRLGLLDTYQKRRMLERAVATIRDIRETIGMPSGPGRDRVLDIHTWLYQSNVVGTATMKSETRFSRLPE